MYVLKLCCCLDAAAQQHPEAGDEEEEEETPNYEEKAQEIVQSILQEVVNTVAGGEGIFSNTAANYAHKYNSGGCFKMIFYLWNKF